MSKWVRGIYNSAANFVLSGSLRAASGRTMGGNNKHVREECNKSDQRVEPSEPIKSSSCATSATGCTRTPTCNEYGIACRHSGTTTSGSTTATNGLIRKHKYVDITVNRNAVNAAIEHDYNEYTAAINAKKQGTSSRVWVGDELRDFKQTHNGTTNDVEFITGIPTGVTV